MSTDRYNDDRYNELNDRCDNGRIIQNLDFMRKLRIDEDGDISYDGRIYQPKRNFIDKEYNEISIPPDRKGEIEVMLYREDATGKYDPNNLIHLGVFAGYYFDNKKGEIMVRFSCGSLHKNRDYNEYTFYVSRVFSKREEMGKEDGFDGGKSNRRRRRVRRRGTRGSRKRNMRQTRSRRQK